LNIRREEQNRKNVVFPYRYKENWHFKKCKILHQMVKDISPNGEIILHQIKNKPFIFLLPQGKKIDHLAMVGKDG